MAFSIRNSRVEEKARAYAAETGETLTGALERALDVAMAQNASAARDAARDGRWERIEEIQRSFAALPVLDPRSPDDILYDGDGMPH